MCWRAHNYWQHHKSPIPSTNYRSSHWECFPKLPQDIQLHHLSSYGSDRRTSYNHQVEVQSHCRGVVLCSFHHYRHRYRHHCCHRYRHRRSAWSCGNACGPCQCELGLAVLLEDVGEELNLGIPLTPLAIGIGRHDIGQGLRREDDVNDSNQVIEISSTRRAWIVSLYVLESDRW